MRSTPLPEKMAAQWVHTHSDELFGYACKRLKDHDTARDLVQETFLAAWRHVDAYDDEKPVRAWLFSILRSKLIDHYRNQAAKAPTALNLSDLHFFDADDHWKKEAYPKAWDTEGVLQQKEFFSVLQHCTSKLKELQQAIFTLKHLDGEESEAICAALNITPNNYWVLMHRAKLQLRQCLQKNWFDQ